MKLAFLGCKVAFLSIKVGLFSVPANPLGEQFASADRGIEESTR